MNGPAGGKFFVFCLAFFFFFVFFCIFCIFWGKSQACQTDGQKKQKVLLRWWLRGWGLKDVYTLKYKQVSLLVLLSTKEWLWDGQKRIQIVSFELSKSLML